MGGLSVQQAAFGATPNPPNNKTNTAAKKEITTMTKAQQKDENLRAGIGFDLAYFEFTGKPPIRQAKLRTCQAVVFETEHTYILQSYGTLIAAISKTTHICFDVLRREYGYTATSAQHISKFMRDYGATKKFTFRFV